MIDYKYQDLFLENSIKKNLIIKFNGGEISNSDIFYETMELTESICSDNQITFGNCEASVFKITIANINVPLEGKWITVSTILDDKTDEPFVFGTYKVASFKPTADRSRRELVAYDAIKDILSADMTDWYNGLAFPMSLKKFRDSFFEHLGFEQEETTLTNDEMVVEKTIESDEISGKCIINAICEINGCFGHVNRNNKFQYLEIALNQFGLYPRNDIYPADDLYPVEPSGRKIANNLWISCEYEDYLVEKIDTLQIRQKENDIGVIIGNGENLYVIQDNFLVYGKSGSDLEQIAKNTFNVIKSLSKYRPYSVECLGNPCIEVGDAIRITAKSEIIESYVLQRTIKGIQSLRDTYKADGQKVRSQNLNSTQKSIKQLKGKTNTLFRSVEETRLEIQDLDKNLSSKIIQNAQKIELEVTRATNAENSLSAAIQVNANNIKLKVSKGEVSSEISQEAGQITIKSNRLVVESTQFKLDASGNATFSGNLLAASGSFSGTVTATSGTFDNVTINSSCVVAGQSISGAITNASWQGSSIGDTYLSGISGSKVGSGFSAGNMTAGTVGRPYSYGGTSIGDTDFSSGATARFTSGMYTHSITPQANYSYNIGSSGMRYSGIYASKLYGTLDSTSSRKQKTNIVDFDIEKSLDIISKTKIVSYNYKTDVADNSERLSVKKRELEDYINLIDGLDEEEKPTKENYEQVINTFNQEIFDIEHERERSPEKRYGFISEDAPWELVSMNRETVDTYSAVAMCFAAIQVIDKRLHDLETS